MSTATAAATYTTTARSCWRMMATQAQMPATQPTANTSGLGHKISIHQLKSGLSWMNVGTTVRIIRMPTKSTNNHCAHVPRRVVAHHVMLRISHLRCVIEVSIHLHHHDAVWGIIVW